MTPEEQAAADKAAADKATADQAEADRKSREGTSDDDRKKLNAENKGLRDRAKAAEEELEKLKAATLSDAEKAIEAARKEGFEQAEEHYKPLMARGRVASRAAGDFHNVEDIFMFLDLSSIDLDSDQAIDEALTKLAADRPYLVSEKAKDRITSEDIDQGPRGGAGGRSGAPKDANEFFRRATGHR